MGQPVGIPHGQPMGTIAPIGTACEQPTGTTWSQRQKLHINPVGFHIHSPRLTDSALERDAFHRNKSICYHQFGEHGGTPNEYCEAFDVQGIQNTVQKNVEARWTYYNGMGECHRQQRMRASGEEFVVWDPNRLVVC